MIVMLYYHDDSHVILIVILYYITRSLLSVVDGNKQLVLSYVNQQILLYLNNTLQLSLSLASDPDWKVAALTWNGSVVSLTNNFTSNATDISPKDFIVNFGDVQIGRDFNGLVQDFIIYNLPLQRFNLPNIAPFLPQCFCSIANSNGDCVEGDKTVLR